MNRNGVASLRRGATPSASVRSHRMPDNADSDQLPALAEVDRRRAGELEVLVFRRIVRVPIPRDGKRVSRRSGSAAVCPIRWPMRSRKSSSLTAASDPRDDVQSLLHGGPTRCHHNPADSRAEHVASLIQRPAWPIHDKLGIRPDREVRGVAGGGGPFQVPQRGVVDADLRRTLVLRTIACRHRPRSVRLSHSVPSQGSRLGR
jgi:hypothetical protein